MCKAPVATDPPDPGGGDGTHACYAGGTGSPRFLDQGRLPWSGWSGWSGLMLGASPGIIRRWGGEYLQAAASRTAVLGIGLSGLVLGDEVAVALRRTVSVAAASSGLLGSVGRI